MPLTLSRVAHPVIYCVVSNGINEEADHKNKKASPPLPELKSAPRARILFTKGAEVIS